MNDIERNQRWLAERISEVNASIADIKANALPLTYLQIGWRPRDGWSIAQVFEHLIIVEQSYVQPLQKLLGRAPARTPRGEWRPSLIGGFLTRSVSPEASRKLPAPRIYRPAPEPRANVIEEYLGVRAALIELMQRAELWDLRRTKLRSPLSPLIRVNIGDAFLGLVKHAQRHLQQIERIMATPEFPRG